MAAVATAESKTTPQFRVGWYIQHYTLTPSLITGEFWTGERREEPKYIGYLISDYKVTTAYAAIFFNIENQVWFVRFHHSIFKDTKEVNIADAGGFQSFDQASLYFLGVIKGMRQTPGDMSLGQKKDSKESTGMQKLKAVEQQLQPLESFVEEDPAGQEECDCDICREARGELPEEDDEEEDDD